MERVDLTGPVAREAYYLERRDEILPKDWKSLLTRIRVPAKMCDSFAEWLDRNNIHIID